MAFVLRFPDEKNVINWCRLRVGISAMLVKSRQSMTEHNLTLEEYLALRRNRVGRSVLSQSLHNLDLLFSLGIVLPFDSSYSTDDNTRSVRFLTHSKEFIEPWAPTAQKDVHKNYGVPASSFSLVKCMGSVW